MHKRISNDLDIRPSFCGLSENHIRWIVLYRSRCEPGRSADDVDQDEGNPDADADADADPDG